MSFWVWMIFAGVALVTGIVTVANDHFRMGNDNIIEEKLEDAIRESTGLDVDLTPEDGDPDDFTK